MKCPHCNEEISVTSMMEDEVLNELKEELSSKIRSEVENDHNVELTKEKEKTARLQKNLAELNTKAKQGSMQEQGEAQELVLLDKLKQEFPIDQFEDIKQGQRGGDIIQKIVTPSGNIAGTFLWESKNTQGWSNKWIGKLWDDKQKVEADLGIIASKVLPANIRSFDCIDNIWVCSHEFVIPVAKILRQSIIDLHAKELLVENKGLLAERVYDYIMSRKFRDRIQTMSKQYLDLNAVLAKERLDMEKHWALRSAAYDRLLTESNLIIAEIQNLELWDSGFLEDGSKNTQQMKQIGKKNK